MICCWGLFLFCCDSLLVWWECQTKALEIAKTGQLPKVELARMRDIVSSGEAQGGTPPLLACLLGRISTQWELPCLLPNGRPPSSPCPPHLLAAHTDATHFSQLHLAGRAKETVHARVPL